MKIVTASNGKKTVKMSKIEWQSIGKKAGWMNKKAWRVENWNGMNIKDIITSENVQEMEKFCYWIGQQMAEDQSSIQQELQRWESSAPGFINFYNKNKGAFQAAINTGKNNALKFLQKNINSDNDANNVQGRNDDGTVKYHTTMAPGKGIGNYQ